MSLIKFANISTNTNPTETQRSVDHYYDHVPSSAGFGSVVGAGMGIPAGLMAGIGINRLGTTIKASRSIPNVKKRVDLVGKMSGFSPGEIDRAVKKIPSSKKIIGGSTAVGAGLGALDGAYKGAMTGVGMNDRQYLLGEDISNDNLVYNSRVSAVKMNSNGGRIGNIYNDRFGKHVGSLRRMFNEERKDRTIKE